MTGNTWILVIVCLGHWLTNVSAEGENECFNEKSKVSLICPEDEICRKDVFGHVTCHLPGDSEPLCIVKDAQLMSLQVKEECNTYAQDCPEDQVCCNTSSGHKCVDKADWERIRDDLQ